jgi:uncharacterized coiled-coil DUF342 family protein
MSDADLYRQIIGPYIDEAIYDRFKDDFNLKNQLSKQLSNLFDLIKYLDLNKINNINEKLTNLSSDLSIVNKKIVNLEKKIDAFVDKDKYESPTKPSKNDLLKNLQEELFNIFSANPELYNDFNKINNLVEKINNYIRGGLLDLGSKLNTLDTKIEALDTKIETSDKIIKLLITDIKKILSIISTIKGGGSF